MAALLFNVALWAPILAATPADARIPEVLAFGDSLTAGFGLSANEAFPARLEARLRARRTDSEEVIQGRMERARAEISHWDGYDYVVVNDEIEGCFAKVKTILEAERLRRARQTGLIEFVRDLTQ